VRLSGLEVLDVGRVVIEDLLQVLLAADGVVADVKGCVGTVRIVLQVPFSAYWICALAHLSCPLVAGLVL
jgi:hypothetical protein